MAADNEIVIEALAKIDQARQALHQLASTAKAEIEDIPKRKEIELETKRSEANLKKLEGALEDLYDTGAKVTKINLPVDDAIAGVERLRSKVDEARATAVDPLAASFKAAGAAVADFGDRSDQSSRKFGTGFERAGVRSRVALKDLRSEIERTRATGGAVTEQDLKRLDALEREYKEAEEAARNYRHEQREVAEEIGRVGSLHDALEKAFPKQTQNVGKAIIAWTTLKTTYNATREALEKLKAVGNDLGVDLDINRRITERYFKQFDEEINTLKDAADQTQFLANAQNILNKRGIEYEPTVEGITRALEAMSDRTRDVALQQKGLVDELLTTKEAAEKEAEGLLRAIAEIQRRGEFTAASAEIVAGKLAKVNEELARLGKSQPGLIALQKQFERLSSSLKMDDAIDSLIEFSKTAEAAGKISREQADSIVADLDRQIKQIKLLPAAEQELYAVRLKVLVDYREEFSKFTTAYIAELEKQRQAREEWQKREEAALASFAEKLRQAFQVGGKVEGPDTSDVTSKLTEARAELAKLQGLPLLSTEDENRIGQLREDISGLETDLSRLGVTSRDVAAGLTDLGEKGKAGAEQAKEAILGLLSGSEEFRNVFQKLPFAVQQALQGLVTGFVSDLDSGLAAGEEDVQRFVSQFASLLSAGGAVSDEFAAKLAALGGAGEPLATLFDGLRKSAEGVNPGIQAVADSLGVVAQKGDALYDIFQRAAQAQEGSIKATEGGVSGFAKVADAASATGEEILAVGGKASDLADGILKIGEDSFPVVAKVTSGFAKIGDRFIEIKQKAEGVADGLNKIPGAADNAAESSAAVADALERVGPAAAGAGDAAGHTAKGLAEVADQSDRAAPPLSAIAGAMGEIEGSGAPGKLGELGSKAGEARPKLEDLQKVVNNTSGAVADLDGKLAALNKTMELTIATCEALEQCQRSLAAA